MLTMDAALRAPRTPRSSVKTANKGILSSSNDTLPLSLYAVMKHEFCPSIKCMFLGVTPPVTNKPENRSVNQTYQLVFCRQEFMYLPPVGIHEMAALPTAHP